VEISQEDFSAWKQHPVTRVVFQALQAQIAEQSQRWSEGQFLRQPPEEQAGTLGRIAGYRAVIELELEDIEGNLNDK
jgi:uncharacterized membrane protein YhfC